MYTGFQSSMNDPISTHVNTPRYKKYKSFLNLYGLAYFSIDIGMINVSSRKAIGSV